MKLLHLLSVTLLTTLSAQAGLFDSFTQINKDHILTPKSATIVAGGLGIWGLGYCVKDLWKVSSALYQGDEAVAELKRLEVSNGPHYKAYKAKDNQAIEKCNALIELLSTRVIHDSHDSGKQSKYYKICSSLAPLNIKADQLTEMHKDNNESVEKAYNEVFIPTREKAINEAKREFKWRAFYDVSAITAISAVGYGAYMLINK